MKKYGKYQRARETNEYVYSFDGVDPIRIEHANENEALQTMNVYQSS